jgi:hypothetical protein
MCLFNSGRSREAPGDLRGKATFERVEGAPLEMSRKEKALLVLAVVFEVIYVWLMLRNQ